MSSLECSSIELLAVASPGLLADIADIQDWINDRYDGYEEQLMHLRYSDILHILIDKSRSLYRTFQYEHVGYSRDNIITMQSRSTFFITLLKCLLHPLNRRCVSLSRVSRLLCLFLKHATDINFYHPTRDCNALTLMFMLMRIEQDGVNEVIDSLFQRKEIQEPAVILYLQPFLKRHIEVVLDSVTKKVIGKHKMFSVIFREYIYEHRSTYYSRDIIKRLVTRSTFSFYELLDMVVDNKNNALIPLIDWKTLEGYDRTRFEILINNTFLNISVIADFHVLIEIYCSIVKCYRFDTPIFSSNLVENIIGGQYRPEHLIFLELTNNMENYKHYLLDNNCATVKYLSKRYKLRYRKFIWFWRHKTYTLNSKIFVSKRILYQDIMTKQLFENNDERENFETKTFDIASISEFFQNFM